jgi:hypothetical protein
MRYFTTLLAVAMALCLGGTALASPINPPGTTAPEAASSSASPQVDLRNPDNRVAPGHPGQRVDTSTPPDGVSAAVSDSSTVPSASDDGLSTFLIVLIAVGGGVLVAGTAVAATRAILHHSHPLT